MKLLTIWAGNHELFAGIPLLLLGEVHFHQTLLSSLSIGTFTCNCGNRAALL
jgi:hypothetical protein